MNLEVGDKVHYKYGDTIINGVVSYIFNNGVVNCMFEQDFYPFNDETYSFCSIRGFTTEGELEARETKGKVLFKGRYEEPKFKKRTKNCSL